MDDVVVFDVSVLRNTETLTDEQKQYLDKIYSEFAEGKKIISNDGSSDHLHWLLHMVQLELEQRVGDVISDGSIFLEVSKSHGQVVGISNVILDLEGED